MRAMLWKDLFVIRGMMKSYAVVLGLFAAMVFAGIYEITFFSAMLIVLVISATITSFSYDEQAGWDKYAAASPVGRRGVVRGKYLFTLVIWASALVLVTLLTAVGCLLHPQRYALAESLTGTLAVSVVGLLLLSCLLPLTFKFGAQKSRILFMVVVGVLVAGGVALSLVAGDRMSPSLPVAVALVFLLAAGGCVLSYVLSLCIFEKKEL